jgi:hypothetical protein
MVAIGKDGLDPTEIDTELEAYCDALANIKNIYQDYEKEEGFHLKFPGLPVVEEQTKAVKRVMTKAELLKRRSSGGTPNLFKTTAGVESLVTAQAASGFR